MKTCNKCHVTKPAECFYAGASHCKPCHNVRSVESAKLRKQTAKGRLSRLYSECMKRHKKRHEGEPVTLKRFRAIYLAHDGVCAETGVSFDWASKDLIPSADRVDNNVGYVDGNIRFVTWRVNNMRGGLSVERFQSTCMEVVNPNASMPVVMADNKERFKKMYFSCRSRHNGLITRNKKKLQKYEGELITFERFEAIYKSQGGVCADTGVPFDWASDLKPSPDRIDNAVGYTDGNIRFVTWRINRMRGGLSVEDFHATCMQLTHHNKRKFDAERCGM